MRNKFISSALFSALAAMSIQTTAFTAQITDFNFDNVPLGSTPPTTAPSVDSLPQHQVYSIGGFPDAGTVTGTVTVQNVGSLSHAAVMTTTQGGTGSLFMDTQFSAPASFASVSFDLNVINVPTSGLPQAAGGALDGQAFVVQAFGLDTNRVFRFAVAPTSATTGNFDLRLPGSSGDLLTFGSYTEGETHHLQFLNDFLASTTSVYLDGHFALTTAMITSGTGGLSELFIFQNGVEGQTNSVAIDNIVLTTSETAITAANPVPDSGSTLALLALALLGATTGFRLRGKAIAA